MLENVEQKKPVPEIDNSLGYLLRNGYSNLQRVVYSYARANGHSKVREVHSTVLRNLPVEGCRAIDISILSGLTKQSVAYIIDDLVSIGYLYLIEDPKDKRAKIIKYTEQGLCLISTLRKASRLLELNLLQNISSSNYSIFIETMHSINNLVPDIEIL